MSTAQLVRNTTAGYTIDLAPGTYVLGDLVSILGPDFDLGAWARGAQDPEPSMGLFVSADSRGTIIGIIGDKGPGRYRTKSLNTVDVNELIGLVPADLAVDTEGQAIEITGPVVYDPSFVLDLGSDRKVYLV